MRMVLSAFAAFGVAVAVAGGASAATTGFYIGGFQGNSPFPSSDPFPNSLTDEGILDGDIDSVALAKFEVDGSGFDDGEDGNAPGDYTDNFTLTISNDLKSGTWSYVADSDPLVPLYVLLKAGNASAVYQLTAGTLAGDWMTNDLDDRELSHIAFFDTQSGPPTNPIPLPAAGWLLISGVAGLGFLSRRKRAA